MSGYLYHTPAEIVRQLLLDLGHVDDFDSGNSWPAFHRFMPDSPDNCVAVYTTQGIQQGRTFDGEVQEHYGIQIKIRSAGTGGYARARVIQNALDNLINTIVYIGAYAYRIHSFNRSSDVLDLGREEPTSDRFIYTINGVVAARELNLGTGTP